MMIPRPMARRDFYIDDNTGTTHWDPPPSSPPPAYAPSAPSLPADAPGDVADSEAPAEPPPKRAKAAGAAPPGEAAAGAVPAAGAAQKQVNLLGQVLAQNKPTAAAPGAAPGEAAAAE